MASFPILSQITQQLGSEGGISDIMEQIMFVAATETN
jgi:hypothetical protein